MKIYLAISIALVFSACHQSNSSSSNFVEEKNEVVNSPADSSRLTYSTHCKFDQISSQFDLSFSFQFFEGKDPDYDSSVLELSILDKGSEMVRHKIHVFNGYGLYHFYDSCNVAVSYTTGFGALKEIVDFYYGSIIVVDMNFDGLDDLAFINDAGGNGGPFYEYHLQKEDKKFESNSFLNEHFVTFPDEFQSKAKKIIKRSRVDTCGDDESIYQYNSLKKTWRLLSSKYVNYCDKRI